MVSAQQELQSFRPLIEETRWNKEIELELIRRWEEEGLFRFSFDPSKPTLIIDTPPPYISGKPHVGQAAHYVQIDMIARAYRMLGFNVMVPFYADRNGLPVELFVEKTYGVNPHAVARDPAGREGFVELCKKRLDEVEQDFVKIWRRLGCSFEYWQEGTDSAEYRALTQSTFIELWKRGLIYEAERPVLWCTRCRTTLAEAEVEYREELADLYYIRFGVEGGGEVIIATTRPELLAACLALAYNPRDERYHHLRGKRATVPIYGHAVDIVEYREVDPSFGTGIMMICSYGDQADVRAIRELSLRPRIIVSAEGVMLPEAGAIAGLPVSEARRRIVRLLEEGGYLVKSDKVRRNVPTCWRCGAPIEIIHTSEYFLKQLEFRNALLEVIEQIKFIPPEHKRKLIDWVGSLSMDWPISKTRYYATEVPAWRCKRCNTILVPEPGRYYRPWKEPPPWPSCPNCGASQDLLVGESKVFDTWFDSSISILYAAGATKRPEILSLYLSGKAKALRPQGYDIIRTWLYYSLLRILQLHGRPAFDYVRISGMGLDEKGEAMHKSKGNVVYPEEYLEKYGADAFRFWAAGASKLGSDYRFSERHIRAGALFVTKLLNIARLISRFPLVTSVDRLYPLDVGILAKLNKVVETVKASYTATDFYEPINVLYHFMWDNFASHYLELAKPRAYNIGSEYYEEEQRSAWYTMHTVLRYALLLLAPIMPFVTDYIWRRLYGKTSIHNERAPDPLDLRNLEAEGHEKSFDELVKLNSAIWRFKKQRGLSLSQPLKGVLYIPQSLKDYVREIAALHKVTKVVVGGPGGAECVKLAEDVCLAPAY